MIILGNGKTGASVYKKFPNAKLIENPDIIDPNIIDEHDIIVKSPGIPLFHPVIVHAKNKNKKIITDIDLFFDINKPNNKNGPFVIAVTGTNGKSSVTSMISHMLNIAGFNSVVGGNIGVPVFELPKSEYYVIELSSYHLEISSVFDIKIACLLNITPDHIDHHISFDNYIDSKYNIFTNAEFGITADNKRKINIPHDYIENASNEDIVFSVGKKLNITNEIIKKAIETYIPLEHRSEIIGSYGKSIFINDSKATNVDSTIFGIKNAKKYNMPIYLILGGKQKSDDFSDILEFIDDINMVYAIGESKFIIHDQMPVNKSIIADTIENVFNMLPYESLKNDGGIVLFSPGCASFDQFKNFEERGKHFKSLYKQLIEN